MYAPHQGATLLPAELRAAEYELNGQKIPAVSASASRDEAGKIHVTLCNLNPDDSARVDCELQGATARRLSGRVLTASEINAHNTLINRTTSSPPSSPVSRQRTTGSPPPYPRNR